MPEPTIAWVHGGGFVAGSKKGVASHVKVLAGDGYTMVAAEYSKGCGRTYRGQSSKSAGARLCRGKRSRSQDRIPSNVARASDSVGAHITSQVALITTDPVFQ